MRKKKSQKRRDTGSVIISILIVLFTLLIVFSVLMLVKETIPYIESRREYDEMQQFILPDEEAVNPEPIIVGGKDKVEESAENPENGEETEPEEKVMGESTCSIKVDFDSLQKINPDIKGWIYIEALDISYPIVQGETNDDYIYTTVNGKANDGGSIFMDFRNSGDFMDPHTLIYGHNMKDGSMFGKLKKMYNQKFVDEWDAPLCFWIITPGGKYRFDIFSIHTVTAVGETYTLFSAESDAVAEYINKMARQTGVELPQRVYNSKDKVITLSTCTSGNDYRLVVQGVLHVE